MARRKSRRQRGRGELFKEGAGWAVRWMEGGKRTYKGGFPTREDAQRVLDKVMGEIALGRAGMPPDQRGVPPLSTFSKAFIDARKRTHRAGAEDSSRWDKHLAPFFGHLRPSEVDAARIKAFIDAKLADGLNPATIRILVSLLSSLMTDLVEQGKAPSNPATTTPANAIPSSASPAMSPEANSVAGSSSRAGPRRHSAIRPPKISEALVVMGR